MENWDGKVKIFKAVLGLIILALIIIALILVVRALIMWDYPKELTAAFVTIVTAFAAQGVSNYFQKKREIEADQRKYKAESYAYFTDFVAFVAVESAMKSGDHTATGVNASSRSMEMLKEFNRQVVLWGSDAVLHQYIVYCRSVVGRGDRLQQEIPTPLAGIEDLILTIRRDLGFRNKGIVTGDIIGMFVNDLHEATSGLAELQGATISNAPGAPDTTP